METDAPQTNDGMEKPLARENYNIRLIVEALKVDPSLRLYVRDRRTKDFDRSTSDGLLKLGSGDTLQAEFGRDTIAVSEHPGEFKLTEDSIAAYREYVKQKAIKAASEPPYVHPVPPPQQERNADHLKEAKEARAILARELTRIFDNAERRKASRCVEFTVPQNFLPRLCSMIIASKFKITQRSGSLLTTHGKDVADFLLPIITSKRMYADVFANFPINTIIVNDRDHTIMITQTR